MNRKGCALFCLALAFLSPAFAAEDEVVTRYLTAANDQYTAKNYAKAFSYITTVLGSYTEKTVPQNVEFFAETVFYAYLSEIKESRDSVAFGLVKESLMEFPYVSSERINRIVKIINTYEAQDIAWGADPTRPVASQTAAASGNSNPVLRNTLELQLALETVRKEAAAQAATQAAEQTQRLNDEYQRLLLESQRSAYEGALDRVQETAKTAGAGNRTILYALFALGGVSFIAFALVLLNLLLNLRAARRQNEKFVETLKAVSELARAPAPAFQALAPTFAAEGEVRMIGSSVKDTGLPPPPATEAEKKILADLVSKCRDVGAEIDAATGRKNNSKNVAELIFKIAQEMGMGQYEATLLFSVGMVYDIGFLEIDPKLLHADALSAAQKFEIRNHVKQGLAQLSFVPERYVPVFADGIQMHHENMDGTGYPDGVQGPRIPFIARVIRVVESFAALVSRRNYHSIYDKESAVAELKGKPGLYDPEIVSALERVI